MFDLWYSGRQIQNTSLCTPSQKGGSSARWGDQQEGSDGLCTGRSVSSGACRRVWLGRAFSTGEGACSSRSPSAPPPSPLTPAHSNSQLAPEGIQNFACWNPPSVYTYSRNNQKLLLTHHHQNLYLIKQTKRKQRIQTDMQSKQSCSYFSSSNSVRHKFCVLDK